MVNSKDSFRRLLSNMVLPSPHNGALFDVFTPNSSTPVTHCKKILKTKSGFYGFMLCHREPDALLLSNAVNKFKNE